MQDDDNCSHSLSPLYRDIAKYLPDPVRVITNRHGTEQRIPIIVGRKQLREPEPKVVVIQTRYVLAFYHAPADPEILAKIIMASIPNPDLSIKFNLIVMLKVVIDDDGDASEIHWGHAYEVPPQQ